MSVEQLNFVVDFEVCYLDWILSWVIDDLQLWLDIWAEWTYQSAVFNSIGIDYRKDVEVVEGCPEKSSETGVGFGEHVLWEAAEKNQVV